MRGLKSRLLRRHSKKTVLLAVGGILAFGLIGGGAYAALGGSIRQSSSGDIELQRGLAGHWKFNGNAKDSTPNSNNGTVNNATLANDRKGVTNAAYNFNGTNAYTTINNSNAFNSFGTGSFTVSAWFKTNTTGIAQQIVDNKFADSNTAGYYLSINSSNYAQFKVADGTTQNNVNTGTTTVTNNEWHHLVGVRDGTGIHLYLDGINVKNSGGGSTFNVTNTRTLYIGSYDVNAGFFSGSIDDVRIYDRAISAAEVRALYEQYDPGVQAASGQSGLVGHWKLDGNAKDGTPHGNNGSVDGPTLTTDRKGAANRAYSFAGSGNNRISFGNSAVFNSPEVTMAAWVYPTDLSVARTILAKELQYKFRITSAGNIRVLTSVDGTSWLTDDTFGGGAIATNNWYHIAVTISSANNIIRAYVNGSEIGTAPLNSDITTYNSNSLVAGAYNASGTGLEPFAGAIDDARFYKRILSAAEIKRQYDAYDSQINLNSSPTNTTSGGNINAGLVGQWSFNGNAKDATPYSNNGIVTGAALTTDRKGRANSAYTFTGNPDAIRVPYAANLMPTAAISVGVWFKANTSALTGNNAQRIVSNLDAADGYALIVTGPTSTDSCGASVLCFRAKINGTVRSITAPISTLVDGNWYYIAGTFDGTFLRIYVNGNLENTSASFSGPIVASTASLCIGANPNGNVSCNANYLNGGSIDEVRLWNRALTLTEIQTLYASPH